MKSDRLASVREFDLLFKSLSAERDDDTPTIVVPAGTCGKASGADDLIIVTQREILSRGLAGKVRLRVTGCHGFCQMEPSVLVEPQGYFYPKVRAEDMPRIVEAAADGGKVDELLLADPVTGHRYEKQQDIPFFGRQTRLLLSRNQSTDPTSIRSYIENGGYSALAAALSKGDREWLIEQVKTSGLRGRGGAGFPTGRKWEMLAQQKSSNGKYVVCNADEGDPGAYMDRSLLEGNPHSIIEGMTISGYATGANEGVVYVRDEYPLAIKHLRNAIRQARDVGLLGEDILGTGFSFEIRVVRGAGAFVCGEETSLIRSIEGKMGEPRQRPPYPVQKGIAGKPTMINNVETWANIPLIFRMGAEKFAAIGTKGNSGTKIFSLVGKIKNTGLVEVPMGISIREVIYDIGGGPVGKAKIKAVQTGGPSGGCIPAEKFDLPIDYDNLASVGSIMGSGGMIVMDENTCMVDVAKYFMNFLKDESCGKCFTCRKGTQRMYELLDDISKGKGTLEHLDLLEELALAVKDTTMCGLGQSAPNPVLSTLRYFRKEYERHIVHKTCDAFVCKDLVGVPCQSGCPLGTETWRYIAHLQRGEYDEAYRVIRETNPLPSVCGRVCHHPCEDRCRSGVAGSQPIAIRTLKRVVTDNADPNAFKPAKKIRTDKPKRVAVVGSGPAGLTAAHYLSLEGYEVTIFESECVPGGMLTAGIPAYRLPREVMQKEIDSIISDGITLKCNVRLGRDITVDGLFDEGFDAVYLALGAHKDRRLGIEGEDSEGVYPSMEFLTRFNIHGESLAKGRVGVIGGGNAAVDAARVAIRQEGVESVNIIYRRTREEMPAFEEEIDAAIQEGILLKTLITPLKIRGREADKHSPLKEEVDAAEQEGVSIEALTTPVKIYSEAGRLTGIECISNELGAVDASGRRSPVPIPGSEHVIPLDTLIVAIGEQPDVDAVSNSLIDVTKWQTISTDPETLCTSRAGVFAGGDAATGPNTVVNAIAAGKRAAGMIDRYLRGVELNQPYEVNLPNVLVEPIEVGEEQRATERVHPPMLPVEKRKGNLNEVEQPLSIHDALREACRCLRCDLEFTKPKNIPEQPPVREEVKHD